MNLHKFICTSCDSKPFFYASFIPVFDDKPSYCPCCGKDAKVEYHNEVTVTFEQLELNHEVHVLSGRLGA